MATTTNYGWTTPDDTDLVKDGAAAIRTLGSSADTTVKNLNPGTTAGDIDYYTSGTAKARIAIGTAGQVLTVNSGGTAPEWKTPAGGGKVLQVVSATTNTDTTIATSTFTDTGLTASITPSATNSKVLVLVHQNGYGTNNNADLVEFNSRLMRDSTVIAALDPMTGLWLQGTRNPNILAGSGAYALLDSPNTTSSVTYKTQGGMQGAGSVIFQLNDSIASIVLMEIGA